MRPARRGLAKHLSLVLFPLDPDDGAWLRERTRLEHPGRADGGRFVLYWMVTALRADDNPCLDAAKGEAARLGLPLLVYQGLTWQAWYASDRTHTFILEGAVDVADALRAQGVRHVLHVARDERDHGALVALARDAAAVFTEDFPCGPLPRWRAALARATGRPVYAVDTACVLPMRVVGRAWERAYAFREATHAARIARLPATRADAPVVSAWQEPMPFAETTLAPGGLRAVVASMRIDHGVGPVPGLTGGARAAVARWTTWRDAHLRTYHARRTDAADEDGASQLSPWLHFGMIAPWRVAAEASAVGGEGAAKYLDELLTWRELAWCFCAHRADHRGLDALPAWAREGLAATAHRRRARPRLAEIERGETGDEMFDLAQRSLLRRGGLHNNARMTWGRTLAGWFADAGDGLRVITDLNHRYALDGRDPASYGGILWCYGQFDRPHPDQGGPLGPVLARPGSQQLKRLDAARYRRWIDAPSRPRCVVVGAGVAGLSAARALHDQGAEVTVLDKGHAPGGRLATRRTDHGVFDHGAQFFTVRDARLAHHLARWIDDGAVTHWFDDAYRGARGMSSLTQHLASGLDVRVDVRVAAIARGARGWEVRTDDGVCWEADVVIVTAPAPQSLALVDAGGVALDPAMRTTLAGIAYERCLAGLFAGPWPASLPSHGVARAAGDALAWLASNCAKGISEAPALTAHATADWSLAHWDDDDAAVLDALGSAASARLGVAVEPVALKRWRYARPVHTLEGPVVHRDGAATMVFAGDAFHRDGGRVEGAALSGLAAAGLALGG